MKMILLEVDEAALPAALLGDNKALAAAVSQVTVAGPDGPIRLLPSRVYICGALPVASSTDAQTPGADLRALGALDEGEVEAMAHAVEPDQCEQDDIVAEEIESAQRSEAQSHAPGQSEQPSE